MAVQSGVRIIPEHTTPSNQINMATWKFYSHVVSNHGFLTRNYLSTLLWPAVTDYRHLPAVNPTNYSKFPPNPATGGKEKHRQSLLRLQRLHGVEMNLSTCTENHGYQNSQHSKSSVSEEQLLGLILLLSGFVVIPNFFS